MKYFEKATEVGKPIRKINKILFYRATLSASAVYGVAVCLSVRTSVIIIIIIIIIIILIFICAYYHRTSR